MLIIANHQVYSAGKLWMNKNYKCLLGKNISLSTGLFITPN